MITIINSVVIICFTILAIHFQHWWIVLFALLFLHWKEKYTKPKDDDDKG